MSWIKLVHWNAVEAEPRARLLESLGYTVNFEPLNGLDFLKAWKEDPPAAVVIDLSRIPSHGREIGMAIRHTKTTRAIPLVFVGGELEKVIRTQGLLPDAVYTAWDDLPAALRQAIENPILEPIAPKSLFDAYAGQLLTKKLGIRPGMQVQLIGAPPDFAQVLGEIPQGASFKCDRRAGGHDLVLRPLKPGAVGKYPGDPQPAGFSIPMGCLAQEGLGNEDGSEPAAGARNRTGAGVGGL